MKNNVTVTHKHKLSVGFGSLLTVLFIGLKLTGYITWSWFWVISPLWIPIAIMIFLLLGGLFLVILATWISK